MVTALLTVTGKNRAESNFIIFAIQHVHVLASVGKSFFSVFMQDL